MRSALLIFFFSFYSTVCLCQTRIDFNVASPSVDTVGWWVAFKDSIGLATNYTIDLEKREDYPILIDKLVRNYYGDPAFNGGAHKSTEAIGNAVYSGSLPPGYVFRYAAVEADQVIVRLEHVLEGGFLVHSFKHSKQGWVYQSNPRTKLFDYMSLFSFALHTQKSAVVAKNPGVIKTLQSECADFVHPFFVQVECVVDLIESNKLMEDPEFIKGLKKIDHRTYGKL